MLRPMKILRALALAVLSLASLATAATAPAEPCPAPPQLPTPEQVRTGVQNARDHGFLWRLSRDGHDSYLFGTIHVGKLDWAFPGPRLREALKATDALAVEIDPTDADSQRLIANALQGSPAKPLPQDLQARLERQIAAACLKREGMATMQPAMQVVVLQMMSARWDGLDASFGQDLVLAGAARAEKRRIVSLESPQRQIDAIVPKDPEEAQTLVENALIQLEKGTVRPAVRRIAEAWERSDLDTLAAYEQWCDCLLDDADRALYRRINDERNPSMAQGIEALHASGAKAFVAVGALHMTGPQGLPKLLAERGFTVTRVEFDR